MKTFWIGGALLGAAVSLCPVLAQQSPAGQPSIDGVLPSGGQRGTVVELSVRGRALDGPTRVLVGGAGVEVRAVQAVSDKETRATLAIAPDAEPGFRAVRVAGRHGLTDPGWFVIGTLPEASEQEPNEEASRATTVTTPGVANGTFAGEGDVDCFRFRARAGQSCVAAVEAFRLDSQVKAGDRWQFTVPVVEIHDAAGRVVAAAETGRSFHPALCFTVPADGEYVAVVHDLAYLGGERAVYRLVLGDVPYPTSLLPAGGTRGERVTARVSGLNLPAGGRAAGTAPAGPTSPTTLIDAGAAAGIRWVLPFSNAGRAMPFITGEYPERLETEPNDRAANAIDLPSVVNGCLRSPRDEDRFSVSLRKDEGVLVDVLAGRVLHSPVDLSLSLLDPAGKQVAENDDSPFTMEETRLRAESLSGDPRLEFTAPEDGTYTLRVRDLAGRGGPECVYRATVTRRSPGFSLSTRYDNPSLPGPGGSGGVFVTLRRWGGFEGPVRVRVVGLPAGYAGGETVLPARSGGVQAETGVVTITAPPTAQPGAVTPFRIEAEATIDGKPYRVEAEPLSPVGDNYRTIPFFRATDGCAAIVVAPTGPVPRTAARGVRGAPGATVQVPLEIERGAAGGEFPLVALRAHRATMGQSVNVPAGATHFDFPLQVPGDLSPGEYSFVVCPPPDGDYRWHRVERCTPVISLVVEARQAAVPGRAIALGLQAAVPTARDSRRSAREPRHAGPSLHRPAARREPRPPMPVAPPAPPVSFVNEVIPVLTRAGCNQGTCHGAAAGRGGLHLSLLGFDPEADYQAIALQGEARRISRVSPGASLLLRKPTQAVPHGGGRRLTPGTPAYQVLERWLAAGSPGPQPAERRVAAISASPADRIMRRGERIAVKVWASFDDGTRRDVTAWSRFSTSQPGVAVVTPEGTVTAAGPGETAVMVRYQSQVTAATFAVPFSLPAGGRAAGSVPRSPPGSYIDAAIEKRWRRLALVPSGECTDSEFIRRVYLDAIGTLPTPEEVRDFLAECAAERREEMGKRGNEEMGRTGPSSPGSSPFPSALKGARPISSFPPAKARARLVDRVLDRPEWIDYWALYFGDLFRNNREVVGDNPMWAFRGWLRESLRQEKPLPEMLRELLAAPGSLRENPALSYFSTSKTPEELAETTSQVLLGVRLQCAKCHNHPFERWTQNDYYAFAAFFARVKIKGVVNAGKFGGDMLVLTASEGEVTHPKTGLPVAPRALGQGREMGKRGNEEMDRTGISPSPNFPISSSPNDDRLTALADWLAAPENPFVARNFANRVWARLMGRGLVDPVDDFRSSNPPSHPDLLDALARDFAEGGCRLKPLMRRILTSRAYQRSARPTRQNLADVRFYSHYPVRRLGAEQLLDAVSAVTGVPERFGGVPAGTRAIALPDNLHGSYFLETFGRPARLAVCECERDGEPNLTQTLHLLNGSYLQTKIGAENGRIATMMRAGATVPGILQTLYQAAFARLPSERERETALALIAEAPTPREGLEDLLWTLLNSREFLLNH